MAHADRIKLLFSAYKAPPLMRGDRAHCLFDCWVVVTGWTAAPILWPRYRAQDSPGGGSGLLVDEELACAAPPHPCGRAEDLRAHRASPRDAVPRNRLRPTPPVASGALRRHTSSFSVAKPAAFRHLLSSSASPGEAPSRSAGEPKATPAPGSIEEPRSHLCSSQAARR